MTTQPVPRNTLAPAYAAAEQAYDCAIALSIYLDTISQRPQSEIDAGLSEDARQYIRHNLINLAESVKALGENLHPIFYPRRVDVVEIHGQWAQKIPLPANGHGQAHKEQAAS